MPSMCTCAECSRSFDKHVVTGWGKGLCPACYRRTLRDRAGSVPRVPVDVVRELKVGLPAELSTWVHERAERLGVSEGEVVRLALAEAVKRGQR